MRYRVLQSYRARGTDGLPIALHAGTEVNFTEEHAAWVNRDSPGTLEDLDSSQATVEIETPDGPVDVTEHVLGEPLQDSKEPSEATEEPADVAEPSVSDPESTGVDLEAEPPAAPRNRGGRPRKTR